MPSCYPYLFRLLDYQIDADKDAVGGEGEVDFKENAKFGSHMKEKGEAASDFSKSKSIIEQRQYLPIFSVRDELLQVFHFVCIISLIISLELMMASPKLMP